MMKAAGKTFEPVIYNGAGHGFMRAGEQSTDENDPNRKARNEAWERWKTILAGPEGRIAERSANQVSVGYASQSAFACRAGRCW